MRIQGILGRWRRQSKSKKSSGPPSKRTIINKINSTRARTSGIGIFNPWKEVTKISFTRSKRRSQRPCGHPSKNKAILEETSSLLNKLSSRNNSKFGRATPLRIVFMSTKRGRRPSSRSRLGLLKTRELTFSTLHRQRREILAPTNSLRRLKTTTRDSSSKGLKLALARLPL